MAEKVERCRLLMKLSIGKKICFSRVFFVLEIKEVLNEKMDDGANSMFPFRCSFSWIGLLLKRRARQSLTVTD